MITGDTIGPARLALLVAGLAEGRRDEEIAADLGVKRSTFTNYLSAFCRAYAEPNRDAIMRTAFWLGWLPPAEDVPLPPLPSHLHQVLRLMAEGMNVREIARRSFCSESTARRYRNQVVAHYGARTRAHAVALAYRSRHLRICRGPASAS
jgi:DNA-binding NarL/FixJ family response regulator